MATRFEIVLYGTHPVALHSAAEEALDEIARLEHQMNLYDPRSDVSRINRNAWRSATKVEPQLFGLIKRAGELCEETQGLFDITLAPLIRCWGLMKDTGRIPDPQELQSAMNLIGMHRIQMDEAAYTIRFPTRGFMLDLGGIGKGFAIDLAVEILRDAGVESALIHGGTSSAYALGRPPGNQAWTIAVQAPHDVQFNSRPDKPVAVIQLINQAFSMSAVWGKAFESEGVVYGHVIDPRSGAPASGAVMSAVVHDSATEADALSTALVVGGETAFDQVSNLREGMRCLLGVRSEKGQGLRFLNKGISLSDTA